MNRLQTEDGSRHMRIWNICVAIMDNEIKWSNKEVSTRIIREYIRTKLKMKPPKDENGDMRATGDAVGGHGLGLERRKYRGYNLVKIDKKTFEIVGNYLSGSREQILSGLARTPGTGILTPPMLRILTGR